MNDRLGYDGQQYAWLTLRLRGLDAPAPREPLAFRIAPAAIVAASGLDVRIGFLALDVAALGGTALVLIALLRRFGATAGVALLGVSLWALLPFTVRAAIHTPVLTDAVSGLLGAALLLCALSRRYAVFAVLLLVGALTRESLLLFAPCAILAARRDGNALRVAVASLPAFAAFAIVRILPPVAPDVAMPSSATLVRYHVGRFLLNVDASPLRQAFAIPLSLGVVLGSPLAMPRATAALARREAAWVLFVPLVVLAGVVGGMEPDRYDTTLAPLLLVGAAPALGAAAARPIVAGALVVAQAIACRAFIPLDGSEASAFAFSVATMPASAIVLWGTLALALAVASTLAMRWAATR